MTNAPKELLDLRHIYYFTVVAEELNLHRAAERLCISQPPLSRQIKQLEESLGLALFVRHTRGLTLTVEGQKTLETVTPLLALHDTIAGHLKAQAKTAGRRLVIGFTTAFDQGIFSKLEAAIHAQYGEAARITRKTSPQLIRAVKNKKVDVAFVALPLETKGLSTLPLGYAEPYVAALPENWPEAKKPRISLNDLQTKPLFWFRHEQNPAFYDFARSVFAQAGFSPLFLEEPAEHDVLLARVAAGEGAALLPASFAIVRREGVVYKALPESGHLRLQLGVVAEILREEELQTMAAMASQALPRAAQD